MPAMTISITIVATGPLTSDALSNEIERLTGSGHLAFYDSISPIVDAESIDMERVYFAARWDKGTADYINCPMDRAEYDRFLDALLAAEAAEAKRVGKARLLRRLPAHRGPRPPRPRHAALRPHEARRPARSRAPARRPGPSCSSARRTCAPTATTSSASRTTSSSASRPASSASSPALKTPRFLRYGQIHRNTYICAPLAARRNPPTQAAHPAPLRRPALRRRRLHRIHRHRHARRPLRRGNSPAAVEPTPVPRATALGSLVHYITHADPKDFQPANITFDLLEPLEEEPRKKIRDKKERHRLQCERALAAFDAWWATLGTPLQPVA